MVDRVAMQDMPLQVPEKVRRKAALLGEAGRVWLADLPHRIADYERRWSMKVGKPMPNGTEAFVADALGRDGRPVVLKIVMPGVDPAVQELRTFRAARGRGCATFLCADEARNAFLLEKLGQ